MCLAPGGESRCWAQVADCREPSGQASDNWATWGGAEAKWENPVGEDGKCTSQLKSRPPAQGLQNPRSGKAPACDTVSHSCPPQGRPSTAFTPESSNADLHASSNKKFTTFQNGHFIKTQLLFLADFSYPFFSVRDQTQGLFACYTLLYHWARWLKK